MSAAVGPVTGVAGAPGDRFRLRRVPAGVVVAHQPGDPVGHDDAVAGPGFPQFVCRDGLGFAKTPAEFGAFPTDPYSHTPRHAGAQQPGMTGQVKEEILTRLGELGVEVEGGRVRFRPLLLRPGEFLRQAGTYRGFDVSGEAQAIAVPAGGLGIGDPREVAEDREQRRLRGVGQQGGVEAVLAVNPVLGCEPGDVGGAGVGVLHVEDRVVVGLLAQLLAVQRLALEQRASESVERGAVSVQKVLRLLVALGDDPADLRIDGSRGLLAHRHSGFVARDRAEVGVLAGRELHGEEIVKAGRYLIAKTLLVLAGVHGNEHAGLLAVPRLLEKWTEDAVRLVVITPVNPVGAAELSRYNADGTLDTTFGVAGLVRTDIATSSDEARGIAIQTDGKILVVGPTAFGPAIFLKARRTFPPATNSGGNGSCAAAGICCLPAYRASAVWGKICFDCGGCPPLADTDWPRPPLSKSHQVKPRA